MAKGYWVGHGDVSNPEGYKDYVARNGPVFAKYKGRFLIRGGQSSSAEGSTRSRTVVIEFPDYDTALACYNSPEYQELVKLRSQHAKNDIVIVEGYEGPQPA